MNEYPLVSICIPTFNGSRFLNEALDSCINQVYPNLELVISDDNSTDSTLNLIKKRLSKFTFPVSVFEHQPTGIGANWNNCIKHSKGKYIKFLFQDDLLYPTCISELVKLVESGPNVALASCKRDFLVEDGGLIDRSWLTRYEDLQKNLPIVSNGIWELNSNDFNFSFFYEGSRNKIGEPTTIMLNREFLNKVGNFREDLWQNLDFECWWRLLENHTILITSKKLVAFRIHSDQATSKNYGKSLPDYRIIRKLILFKYIWKMPFKESRKILLKEASILWKAMLFRISGVKGYNWKSGHTEGVN